MGCWEKGRACWAGTDICADTQVRVAHSRHATQACHRHGNNINTQAA